MAISKVIYKTSPQDTGTVWMDATPATASASDITAPKTAMLADGVMTTGTGSGGGGDTNPVAQPKDVNFIDYDGTIRYSYTAVEAQALSALPANPTHAGLVAQGWNWTLAEIKAQLTAMPNAPVWVGQMYITQSGDTEIDVHFPDSARLSPIMTIAVNGTVTVDWGDGTTADTVTGTSLTTRQAIPHTYANTGDYTIVVHVVTGEFSFYCSSTLLLLRKNNTNPSEGRVYANTIQRARLGSGITSIGSYAFYYCYSLTSITIPNSVTSFSSDAFEQCVSLLSATIPSGVTSLGTYTFSNCNSLVSVSLPSGLTSMGNNTFSNCASLRGVSLPSGLPSIGTSFFSGCYSITKAVVPNGITSFSNGIYYNCYSLASATVPSDVTSIGTQAFQYCYGLAEIHFKPTTPPTVSNSNAFTSIPTDCKIYVPTGHKNDYTGATNYPSSATYTYIEE